MPAPGGKNKVRAASGDVAVAERRRVTCRRYCSLSERWRSVGAEAAAYTWWQRY